MMRPEAVLFDAFETLLEKPVYHDLWKAVWAGRDPDSGPVPDPMITPLGLRGYAEACGTRWRPEWDALLEEELAAIRPFPDAEALVARFAEAGVPRVVASNLALPYGPRVRELLGGLVDGFHFSYEVGLKKPDPEFLRGAAAKAGAAPHACLLIGNSPRSDRGGGEAAGMRVLLVGEHGMSRTALFRAADTLLA